MTAHGTSVPPNPGNGRELPSWELEVAREAQAKRVFCPSLLAFALVFLGLLFGLTKYTQYDVESAKRQIEQYYHWFIHVNFMIFVGFGFLMTFLRRYSLGAVSLNMLASVVMFVEAILMIGATQQVIWGPKNDFIRIDIPLLIDCAFCAGSGMIAFGAVIGKVSPTQLLWMVFAQVPIYAFNQHLVIYTFKALDMGGTIVIHLFGAYYGLAVSWMLKAGYPKINGVYGAFGSKHPKYEGSYLNDVFSMIGTLFLWLYWPSFNGALASVPLEQEGPATAAQESAQFLSVVNTLLSLMGAAISTFAVSSFVGNGRINMMHVQNSTLAGGVAMGAACTLQLTPGAALLVGMAAGTISVIGYQYLTPFLEERMVLGDTCGIHNLHAMPAILGCLVAGLASLGQDSDYLFHASGRLQLGYQVLTMVVTIAIAIAGGLIVGRIMVMLNPTGAPYLQQIELFDDGVWWFGLQVEPMSHGMPEDVSKHSDYSVSKHRHNSGYSIHRPAPGVAATTAAQNSVMPIGGTFQPPEASPHLFMQMIEIEPSIPVVHMEQGVPAHPGLGQRRPQL